MNKVLIDRALLERVVYALQGAYERDMLTTHDHQAVLDAPSGTPMMPVKAYYHEWTDLEGVRTRSVGLEVRKEFADAPLVLESDALARIACLEGEIAKRDAELCERTEEVEHALADLNNALAELAAIKAQEPVAWRYKERADDQRSAWLYVKKRGHVPGGRKFEALYSAPVSEAKAQAEAFKPEELRIDTYHADEHGSFLHTNQTAVRITHLPTGAIVESKDERSVHRNKQKCLDMLPAAIEAKSQGVVQWPEADEIRQMVFEEGQPAEDVQFYCFELEEFDLFIEHLMSEVARLNAAPVQQVSVPDVLREAIKWADHLCFECGALVQTRAPSVHVYNKTFEAVQAAKAMLAAAPVQQVSVPDAAFRNADKALDLIVGIRHGKNVTQDELWQACELLDAALAAHRAKGVV